MKLVKKICRIADLSQRAIQTIVKDIVPVLSSIETNSQMIGVIYRNENESGIQYILVESEAEQVYSPIIEFRKERVETYPNYDEYFVNCLGELNKTQDDIISSGSSALICCFDDKIFHNVVYKHIESMFKKIFEL